VAKTSGTGQDQRTRRAGDWAAAFEDVELSWSVETPHEEPVAEPDHAPAEAAPAITRRMRRARRSRRRAVVIAAVAAALVVCGAVATVAIVRRGGGEESSSRTSTTAASERAAVTTTIAPPTTTATTPSTAPPSAAPAPGPFTVRSTCGGRACTVAVHVRSTTAAAKTGSLRNGDVVQVSCSTHGEPVGDRDTGQRSDVWYRLDSGSYVSGLYVEGPTVPDCG
jgi:hypothetical protein